MTLSGSIIVLLLVAAAVALAARRLRAPYTVALVVAGLLLSASPLLHPPALTKELLFAVFLPGLLFEAAFHLDAEEFWRNRVTVFSLALPAVVLATLLTAAALVFALRAVGIALSWGPAFVFATLIAATDPIAVVALVRTLGAPTRLGVLIGVRVYSTTARLPCHLPRRSVTCWAHNRAPHHSPFSLCTRSVPVC